MKAGLKPALVQWKLPFGQAAVPANKCVVKYAKQLLNTVITWKNIVILTKQMACTCIP